MRHRPGRSFPRAGHRRRRPAPPEAPVAEPPAPDLSPRARDTDLVLHIGLHKTATSYLQGVLAALRDDLHRTGLLFPVTGVVDKGSSSTRDGAGSGQALFSRRGKSEALLDRLYAELTDDTRTVLISSEEFARPRPHPTPERLLARFGAFRSVRVVLVLRRQDDWVESYYKQVVDQFGNYETRSFADYVQQSRSWLLDYHARFAPWRDLVGPDRFHVLSYDDLADGAAICRRLLEICGVRGPVLEQVEAVSVPRYDSVRAIDTLGLRLLNACRLEDRDARTGAARAIYDLAPAGDIALMTDDLREEIRAQCEPVNQRIEEEWCDTPVPGLRFGADRASADPAAPTGPDMIDYVDRVMAVCAAARGALPIAPEAGGDGDG